MTPNLRTLNIAATFTAEPLIHSVQSWLRSFGLNPAIEFVPYNQVLQNLVDQNSILSRNAEGANVFLIRLPDWIEQLESLDLPQLLAERSKQFLDALQWFVQHSASQNLVVLCPTDLSDHSARKEPVQTAELDLMQQLRQFSELTVITSEEIESLYPLDTKFDPIANRTGHLPFTIAYFASLGTGIARKLVNLHRHSTKMVVLDCDNTLWNGVCGEVGSLGVVIEAGHRELQQRMIELRQRGILLALCSKNIEADVWSVFEQNQSMLLRREHFSAVEISWKGKSAGLREIAQRVGLGQNSLLFLDDNPLEIAEVRAHCPEVIALQIPPAEELAEFLNHIWPLDSITVTADDQLRAQSYQDESARQAERKHHVSLRSFLESLELQVQFFEITADNLARAVQLIERTNQFNLTLKRRSSAELRQLLALADTEAFLVEMADKFGHYGIVGIVLGRQVQDSMEIDTLALSCRALGRGVEYRLLRELGRRACDKGVSQVDVTWVPGERNEPAARFLETISQRFSVTPSAHWNYRFLSDLLSRIDPLEFCETGDEPAIRPESNQPNQAVPSSSTPQPSQWFNTIARDLHRVDSIVRWLEGNRRPRPRLNDPLVAPTSELERQVAEICCRILQMESIGMEDPLHRLGASSLQLVLIHSELIRRLGFEFPITELYSLPTVAAIAQFAGRRKSASSSSVPVFTTAQATPGFTPRHTSGVAIVGMAGRFPGADSVAELWENLMNQVNSIVPLTDEELNLAADSPLRKHPNLVRRSSSIRNADQFDAKFFGIFPKEAKVMDPQHRLMLECCWTALEDGGYCPDRIEQAVGVYAGCYLDTYILASLQSNPELIQSLANSFHGGDLHTELGNDKDYLATRISYLLNLCGPSMTIQTACSTSLVAIIQACQAIEDGHCEMALAGGATMKFPQGRGYLYTEGGMVSPDGICRPFDADARGTVFGEGVAVVLLKQLDQAIADGDEIYGVIRGWGINNDGRSKMAYTAPSVNGQSAAIEMAHRKAGISADTITYVEAHGTGTSLGDPIEVDALTKAFRKSTNKKQFCGIGSVKSNIGHLDVAAGVTGLIKICQAFRHQTIPASLHVKNLNPNIDFANSPFFVVTEDRPWKAESEPRRAGLSSFGVGGTNAHIVVEEAPRFAPTVEPAGEQLLVLSARSAAALETMSEELAAALAQRPQLRLADVAYTLRVGRKAFMHKRILVARDSAEAIELLGSPSSQAAKAGVFSQPEPCRKNCVDFIFPGQGSQHLGMAANLYQYDKAFRQLLDECCDILRPMLGFDLRDRIFGAGTEANQAAMNQTGIAQPAIFAVSYSLAKRLEQLGLQPQRMVGHSVGEFVAACLAGVFSLADALRLISFRAQQMQVLPPGGMVAVRIREADLGPRLEGTDVEIAAINSPELCVISGPHESVMAMQEQLEAAEMVCRSLHTSHAFHSQMMNDVIEPFEHQFAGVELSPPAIPIISSVTGQLLTDTQATDPRYWARHLRETVRFADATGSLLRESENIILEVGPGQALGTLVRQHSECQPRRHVFSVSPHAKLAANGYRHWLVTLGRLWLSGATLNWYAMADAHNRTRVHLPTYPFERQRYWFDDVGVTRSANANATDSAITSGIAADTSGTPSQRQPIADSGLTERGLAEPVTIPEVAPPLTSTPPVMPSITEQVIRQQLQLMQLQLKLWNR